MTPRATPPESAWACAIADRFTPGNAHIVVAFDPDQLLAEETTLSLLNRRGFTIVRFDDPIKFRFVYEDQYRATADARGQWNLLVVVSAPATGRCTVPYDVFSASEQVSLSLTEFFPGLSYPVVQTLQPRDYAVLYEAVEAFRPGDLSELQTKDFVLRHVFEIAVELTKKPTDLLRLLARRHYRGLHIPASLDRHIIESVRARGQFTDWPLEILLPNRELFFTFLQERWPIYLDRVAANTGLSDRSAPLDASDNACTVPGPRDLPFGHDDVHVYIDNLFYAGLLTPVAHPLANRVGNGWIASGLVGTSTRVLSGTLDALVDRTAMRMPDHEARHSDWVDYALEWAEMVYERWLLDDPVGDDLARQLQELTRQVDERFTTWVMERYGSLHNLVGADPVMVHHVPRALASLLATTGCRGVALVVVDGMSLDQWLIVRDALRQQLPDVEVATAGCFAWAPTLTSVSRQALFAGEVPQYFPGSILTTAKEPALWLSFWADQGLAANEVGFDKGLAEHGGERRLEALLGQPKLRVVGIIVNAVDSIMHGATLGMAGMHSQVRQWAAQGHFAEMLRRLIDEDFEVVITSDHGNVEAWGVGSPFEKSLADVRGERVRVFPNDTLRGLVRKTFPTSIAWDPVGLPPGFSPLFSSGRDAFITSGKRTVAHGGIALEELIVPFVRVHRKGVG